MQQNPNYSMNNTTQQQLVAQTPQQQQQQQQWVVQQPQQPTVIFVTQTQNQNNEEAVLIQEIESHRKCLMVYMIISLVIYGVQLVYTASSEGQVAYYVSCGIGIGFTILMLYGVYSYNPCLITTGLVLCYLSILLIVIGFILLIVFLVALYNAIDQSDPNQSAIGGFVAMLIIFSMIPLVVALIIYILLIVNYGRYRKGLQNWKFSHGGVDYYPKN